MTSGLASYEVVAIGTETYDVPLSAGKGPVVHSGRNMWVRDITVRATPLR